MSDDRKVVGVVDMTPTWSGLIDVLVELASKGDSIAKDQLRRLAAFADEANKEIKGTKELAGTEDEVKYTIRDLEAVGLVGLSIGLEVRQGQLNGSENRSGKKAFYEWFTPKFKIN